MAALLAPIAAAGVLAAAPGNAGPAAAGEPVDFGSYAPVAVTTQLPAVGQVAFSPDGEHLALLRYADRMGRIAVNDEGLALVDPGTGKEVLHWTGEVRRVRFSPRDGEMALLDSFTLRLAPIAHNLAMSGGLLSRQLDVNEDPTVLHDSGWNDLAYGSELLVVSGGSRGQDKLALWRGTSLERVVALEEAPWFVDLAPDDTLLAAAYPVEGPERGLDRWSEGAGRVELRDLSDESPPRQLPDVRGGIHRLGFDPQGRLLAADGAAVLVWDIATGAVVARWEANRGRAVFAWSGDGRHLAVGDEAGRLGILDVVSGATVHRMDLDVAVHSVALSPDGRFLAVADGDGRARLWRATAVRPGAAVPPPTAPPPPPIVAPTPGEAPAVDYAAVRETRRWQPEGGARAAALDPAGTRIAFVPWDQGATIVVNLADGEVEAQVAAEPPHHLPGPVAFSPTGDRLAISGMGTVDVHRVPGMERMRRFERENPGGGRTQTPLAFGPGGNVLVATAGPTVLFFDVDSGDRLRTLTAGRFGIEKVALSPDGSLLVTYGADQDLKVWPLANLVTLSEDDARVLSQGRHIGAFAFSPDGSTLAAADREGQIHLFDSASGSRVGGFAYGEAWVPTLVYTPDGQQLIGGGGDGSLRVWDPSSGQLLATHAVGDATVFATLTSDGSALLAQPHRGDVVVLRPGEP